MNFIELLVLLIVFFTYLAKLGRWRRPPAHPSTASGGFDGFMLAFADGTDIDTVRSLMPPEGWCVDLTFSDHHPTRGVYIIGVEWDQDEGATIAWYPTDPTTPGPTPVKHIWAFDTLTGITIL